MAAKRAFPILDDELETIRTKAAAPGAIASAIAKDHEISVRTLGRIVDRAGPYATKEPAASVMPVPVQPVIEAASTAIEEEGDLLAAAPHATIETSAASIAPMPKRQPGGVRGFLSRLFGIRCREAA